MELTYELIERNGVCVQSDVSGGFQVNVYEFEGTKHTILWCARQDEAEAVQRAIIRSMLTWHEGAAIHA